ncbi:L-lactate dehydrogenase complex protein LldE [Algoriphagus locisalis]|uniref:L-lactate dehydrogenase complex protein LldE n=1 Tax=Algoriphagus locisalis TaxID=305507 RepID=A0A1I7BNQ2_9BACT|nr:(Fe-S)-binding protein [Algoriphagus locisalis]SFT88820.1 L-lactate dehydrogenase complex protein LldE [Algoriphagus locisalis]
MNNHSPHIGLFIPCYIDQFYPNVAIATLELLEKLGCKVTYPLGQTCCGQPMANSGFEADTLGTTSKFIRDFAGFDYIVAPSGSCVLHVKEHSPKVDKLHKNQAYVQSRIYELSEFITDVLKVDSIQGSFPHKIGFHASCHGLRGLRLASDSERNEPAFNKTLQLMRELQGMEVVELTRKDECCGFGGTFAVSEEAISVQMGKDRIADHLDKGVEIIVGGDMSCLMHMQGIATRDKNKVQLMHFAEILNQAIS